ncbi:hypothetical protein ACFVU3_06305 [Streptomyces sp. NPDC058052]|uniref:hypothetical protein n=1 Tax=Streptomyces sp. NPDC058052 TaxID=3346316 RepID=UPI0036EC7B0A
MEKARGVMAAGIVADGIVKVLLGGAFLAGAAPAGRLLGVPGPLCAAAGAALLLGGAVELALLRRRPLRRHLPLMAAYDGGWALAAAAGALVAWRGGGSGGELWVGYQAVAPLAFAALLAAGPAAAGVTAGSAAPSRPGSRS